METEETAPAGSKVMRIVGWVLSVLVGLMLALGALMKLFGPANEETKAGLDHIGWDAGKLTGLGILELTCAVLFLIPKTSVLGAILVAGYMGGAIATHVRVGDPVIVQVLIPIIAWLGLWLREQRLRAILPLR